MSLFTRRGLAFAGRRRKSLFVAEPLVSASLVSQGHVFDDVNIGSPATDGRTVLVVASCKDAAAVLNTADGAIELGGLPMTRRNGFAPELPSGADMGIYIFSAAMGASYGQSAALEIKSIVGGTQLDSIAFTVLATHLEGDVFVDGVSGANTGATGTANNVATADDGYVIAASAMELSANGLVSVVGNGSTGALSKVVDQPVQNNHRHAVAIKAGLSAGTTEDFTWTVQLSGNFLAAITSRQ